MCVSSSSEFQALLKDVRPEEPFAPVCYRIQPFRSLTTLNQLDRANMALVIINENIDVTTPKGKVIVTTLAGFSQYSSDNHKTATKKSQREGSRAVSVASLQP
jgi:DNA invertase Pin-like site-specific DNA recombinase